MGCGLSATAVFLTSLVWSAANDPSFVPFSSYLSDLGVGPGARAFNAALVTAGLLTVPFAVLGLWPAMRRSVSAALATASLCLVGAFTVLVGLYTEDAPEMHFNVSLGVFISMAAAAVLTWWTLRIDHPLGRWVTELTQAVGIFAAFLLILLGHPFFETLFVLAAFAWLPVVAAVRLHQLLSVAVGGAGGIRPRAGERQLSSGNAK